MTSAINLQYAARFAVQAARLTESVMEISTHEGHVCIHAFRSFTPKEINGLDNFGLDVIDYSTDYNIYNCRVRGIPAPIGHPFGKHPYTTVYTPALVAYLDNGLWAYTLHSGALITTHINGAFVHLITPVPGCRAYPTFDAAMQNAPIMDRGRCALNPDHVVRIDRRKIS